METLPDVLSGISLRCSSGSTSRNMCEDYFSHSSKFFFFRNFPIFFRFDLRIFQKFFRKNFQKFLYKLSLKILTDVATGIALKFPEGNLPEVSQKKKIEDSLEILSKCHPASKKNCGSSFENHSQTFPKNIIKSLPMFHW